MYETIDIKIVDNKTNTLNCSLCGGELHYDNNIWMSIAPQPKKCKKCGTYHNVPSVEYEITC